MRKRLLIIAATVVAVTGVAIAVWSYQANQAKNRLIMAINDLNSYGSTLDRDLTMVRYDSVDSSGFPFAINLSIHKPILEIPVSAILDKKSATAKRVSTAKMSVLLSGSDVSLSNGASPDDTTIRFLGPITSQFFVDHRPRLLLKTVSDDYRCSVASGGKLLEQLHATSEKASMPSGAFIYTTTGLHCEARNQKIFDATNVLVYQTDETNAVYTNAPNGSNNDRKIHIAGKIANGRYSAAGDAVIRQSSQIVADTVGLPATLWHHHAVPLQAYGRIDEYLDLDYSGPVDQAAWRATPLHMNFDIHHLAVKNDLFRANLVVHTSANSETKDDTDAIAIHGDAKFSDRYDQLAMQAARGTPEQALIFALHPLGGIKLDVEAAGNISSLRAQGTDSSIKIRTFAFNTAPYGLGLQGDYWHRDQLTFADMTLTCRTCDRLLGDASNYAGRAQQAIAQANGNLPYHVSSDQLGAARTFAHQIADVPGKPNRDLQFHFSKEPDGQLLINGKSLVQIFMLMQGMM